MNFFDVFPENEFVVIGMIHCYGKNLDEIIKTAETESRIYDEAGLHGIIVENYGCGQEPIPHVLKTIKEMNLHLEIGINILPNEFGKALELARKYDASFIQLDYVAGQYWRAELNFQEYSEARKKFPKTIVLGGVHPKYYTPISDLESDLEQGVKRAEAIVVTGEATGKQTPLTKIKKFRETIGLHPLIVGAGLTAENVTNVKDINVKDIAQGGIVGTYFKKEGLTANAVDKKRVIKFMNSLK